MEQSDPGVLFSTADNPTPGNHVSGYFTTFDRRRLRYAIFKTEKTVARGTIVLLQGRNETIEKYYETIRHFTARGLWVATFDWRGQGGSPRLLKNPLRGHVRRFADFERDLTVFLETIVLPETRLPFFLVAHSMGSLVALSAAPKLANRIERMALVAPFVAMSGLPVSAGTLGVMARMLSSIGLGWLRLSRDGFPRPFADNALTSDRQRFERNQGIILTHPGLRQGPATVRWVLEMSRAIRRVNRFDHLDRIRVPTLLIAAGNDSIVDVRAVTGLANRFRAGSAITIDGARHELLQEADRYRLPTLAAIDAFIPVDQSDEPAAKSRDAAAAGAFADEASRTSSRDNETGQEL
ncbi:lysophospholipase [Hoeflea marina]|uniref:Lysophospholipase n=1 Tax=Hoeflea marina TaxID=274592 RepID=A0A317PFH5_9HYPH|nr:alpha/beta hydrolase [Hoeflea marina]PWV97213.1 lysophospholipase [Hoeflea marina]